MKHSLAILLSIICIGFAKAQTPDPNFYIFLCFGQSNMEGQGPIESQDQNPAVNSRFQVMQAVACNGQPAGKWRTASAPIARCNTKIGPTDYFGREMVSKLPSNIKIGVVHVSVLGSKIELFDKTNFAAYLNGAESYVKSASNEYGGNPYAKLVELAKLAQKDGVIKGILMHQGESNTGETAWPGKVKSVYTNLLTDLGLTASNVPLLVGQVVDAAQGGQCASHNTIIDKIANTIPTAHVISSANCPAQSDKLHFTTAGYRTLGARYATMMLSLLPAVSTCSTAAPTVSSTVNYELGDASVALTATGTSIKWYTVETGGTASTTAPKPSTATVGTTNYYVSQTANGCESDRSKITVNISNTYKIFKVNSPITIDGTLEDVWNNVNVMPMNATKLLSGTVTNATDLSGFGKMLWDNNYLYMMATVTDDIKTNDSQNSYEDDLVEFYIDTDNAKATTYDANDFQYSYGWNDGTKVGVIPSTGSISNITYSAVATSNGYIVEARIPWSTINVASPAANKLLGVDFMINDDDDNGTRDGKLSWNAATDNAYQNASLFGTAKLMDQQLVTDIESNENVLMIVFPNPATNQLTVSGLKGKFNYEILNLLGSTISTGESDGNILLKDIKKGTYILNIKKEERSIMVKFIISE